MQVSLPFPDLGEVYDYKLDDAGISQPLQDEDEEEENKNKKVTTTAIILLFAKWL